MICWGRSTSCFIYSFVIQVISEKALWSNGFTSNLRDIFTWKLYFIYIILYIYNTVESFDCLHRKTYWWTLNKLILIVTAHKSMNERVKSNDTLRYCQETIKDARVWIWILADLKQHQLEFSLGIFTKFDMVMSNACRGWTGRFI